MRSVGEKGYGLSRQINEKLEALLKHADTITAHPALPPSPAQPHGLLNIVQEIRGSFNGDLEEEEDVCITFEESAAVESVCEAAIRCKTQDHLKKRKESLQQAKSTACFMVLSSKNECYSDDHPVSGGFSCGRCLSFKVALVGFGESL